MDKGSRISISLNPDGTLNYVNSFQTFKEGDLSDSINTRIQQAEANNVVQRALVKGTRDTFDFSPEPVVARNGRFRVNFSESASPITLYTLGIFDANNVFFFAGSFGGVPALSISDILLDFTTNFPLQMGWISQTVNIISSTTDTATTGHVIFEITTIPYANYTVDVTDSGYATGLGYVADSQPQAASDIGDWIPVASKDLNGDLFSLWTTIRDLPNELDIVSGTNDGSGGYLLTFAINHNYMNDGLIVIKGTPIDGQYIIQSISPTELRLLGTVFTSNFSGGVAIFYPRSISEFGVATRDGQTGAWTYIRLVRTNQWNIRAVVQPEIGHAEDNIFRKSFYWCDHYNPDRCFYYKGAYIQDGAIQANNPDGLYDYATIGQETKLIQNNQSSNITFIGQSTSGGSLLSGTYRYSGRFLSDDRTPTGLYLEPTGQINVYSASGNPNTIGGDEGGTITGKVNNFTVSFDANLFRYFELIAVYYTGGAQSATLVKRVEISDGQTSLNISHTGSEPSSEAFDVGQLLTSSTIFDISKTLTVVDNFMVRSNMKTSSKQYDLSGFFATFLHDIKRKEIESIGSVIYPPAPLSVGEYQIPLNMESFGAFMFFETYRLMGKVRYKDGSFSQLFWIDDIRVDFNTYNIDPAYPDNRRGANEWNTSGYFINNFKQTFIPYLDFYGYDLNYIIEGVTIGSIIDEIIIERAEVVREVLSSGITVPGVTSVATAPVFFYFDLSTTIADAAPYPFVVGNNELTGVFSTNPAYPSIFDPVRDWGFYYAIDGITNGYHDVLPGDQIFSFGNTITTVQKQVTGGTAPYAVVDDAEYREFSAVTSSTTFNTVTVDDGGFVKVGETFSGVNVANTFTWEYATEFVTFVNQPCLALHFTSNLNNSGAGTDYGCYQSYYYRGVSTYDASYNPDTSKYGNRKQSQGVVNCEMINTAALLGVVGAGSTKGTFGQDVFTQGTFMKLRAPYKETNGSFSVINDPEEDQGYAGGMLFYSQNIINIQMIFKETPEDFNTWNFPTITDEVWLRYWKGFQDSVPYDQSYSYINKPVIDVMFDSEVVVSQLPATYFYSARKPLNSFIDPFRQFFPLNFVDENLGDGEIITHVVVANKIYGLQPNSFRRRFLNSNAVLNTTNGSEVVIGDGSVLARVSEEISNIGCTNKFSALIGRSRGGNQVLYYWNTTLKCVVRFGLDGTNPISFVHGIEPFIRDNVRWVTGKDTPAAGEGICCTWNEINKEAIWTVQGYAELNDMGVWDEFTIYNYLDEVSYGETYVALGTAIGTPPDVSPLWVKKYDESGNYTPEFLLNFANLYTIVFSEIQNGFSGFRSFTPNIYFQYRDTYLSSGVDVNEAATGMWEHEIGVRAKFYGVQYDGYDEWVVAKPFNNAKNFGHIRVRSALVPARVDFTTSIKNPFTGQYQYSYLTDTNFTTRNDFHDSSIRWDASVTPQNPSGLNTIGAYPNNGKLTGDYIKIKLTYSGASEQLFNQAEINFNLIPKYNYQ